MFNFGYLCALIFLWLAVFGLYNLLSKGLSKSARHQQAFRFLMASACAVLPATLLGLRFPPPGVLWGIFLTSALWTVTFPLIDFLVRRHHAIEIDNKMDYAFGLYLFGWLTALWGIGVQWMTMMPVVALMLFMIELLAMLLPLGQWLYWMAYHANVDHDSVMLAINTNKFEAKEFIRSFPWTYRGGIVLFLTLLSGGFICLNVMSAPVVIENNEALAGLVFFFLCLTAFMFHGKHAVWRRVGLIHLFLDCLDYMNQNKTYQAHASERQQCFSGVKPVSSHAPKTIVLVVGESASKLYMHAFVPQADGQDTTPWLTRLSQEHSQDVTLFQQAYSCHIQTVPTLTHALTGANQTDRQKLNHVPSLVDAAHALGYRVHWYSNQSHIGAADTPISLMAECADNCAWTQLSLKGIPYDEALLDFLPRVSPKENNLIILHLIGSHFNYANRYPKEKALFQPESGKMDDIVHYKNSLAYTDRVLQQVYDYCTAHLNLAAMVYCSDHGEVPSYRRSPVFEDVSRLKIPLFVALSPWYSAQCPLLNTQLKAAAQKMFVNDYLYDLMLGVLSPENFSIPDLNPPLYSMLGELKLEQEP